MSSWAVVVVILSAVLVGAWIPVAVQLLLTLRSANRVLGQLGHSAQGLGGALKSVEQLAQAATQLQDSLRLASSIGAAVGPAVAAFIHALRTPTEAEDGQRDGGNGSGLAKDSRSQPAGLE